MQTLHLLMLYSNIFLACSEHMKWPVAEKRFLGDKEDRMKYQ
jgi:hypothetical protein